MKDNKHLYKIAQIIRSNLNEWSQAIDLDRFNRLSSYAALTQKLTDLMRQHKKAMAHSWFLAVKRIRKQIAGVLQDLNYAAHNLREISLETHTLPACSVILADLLELDRELGPIQFDSKGLLLSIVTDSIKLEGICLGPFRIELALNQLKELHRLTPYKCLAEEPYPAGTDDTVTHPHVSGNSLCEGDGKVPIRRALEQGRLCDFFTLITHILNTYNTDSPYIRLDEWEGTPCYDCDQTTTLEDRYTCEYCNRNFCEECSSCCRICDLTCCLHCGGICHGCEEFVCRTCSAQCAECEEHFCIDCLTDGLCETCIEQKEKDHETQKQQENQEPTLFELETCQSSPATPAQGPQAAIQSHSLGQAPVLQGQNAE